MTVYTVNIKTILNVFPTAMHVIQIAHMVIYSKDVHNWPSVVCTWTLKMEV